MNNLEAYNNAFKEAFDIEEKELAGLEYHGTANWDSVGHMNLISAIEDAFDIMLETDDIIDFTSYEKGKIILAKYDKNIG
ncbi:MAG: acyl carrier protein [Ruminococcaceae bacterium]|nr:acyl carrier protein [Oscillospiraceae bacterium]